MENLASATADDLRRYPDPTSKKLCEKIAELHNCSVENVLASNGSDEVLSLCAAAFVENNGIISSFDPSYSLYPVLAAIRDVKYKPVALSESFGWQEPEHDEASLFYLTNPNAPTGLLFPKEKTHAFCQKFRGVVLMDEAYVDFASENSMNFATEFDNVIVARTLSKSYSLAGIRLGYAVGSVALIEALSKIRDSYNVNYLTQKLGLAALSDRDYHRATIEKIKATRSRLSKQLEECNFTVIPSEANFVWAKPNLEDAEVIFNALREKNVFVRYFPGIITGDYLRITVGTDEQIDRFFEALQTINKRRDK
jgi:histidinol-phosphate aminotransferase